MHHTVSPGSPHNVAFDDISVLVPTGDSYSVRRFTDITETVRADFEFGLIDHGVSVSRSLDHAKLSSVRGIRAMNIQGQSDYSASAIGLPWL
jgi:hypothetical protein